jgi:hypothetical protein
METTTTYEQQAIDFLNATNTEFKAEFIEHNFYFEGDKEKRDIYKITLKRGNRRYSFKFGQSIVNSGYLTVNKKFKSPTPYDVLACLEKYEHETFKDFCDNFGYDTDSRSAKKIYKACKKQFEKLSSLYNESEMDLLREIN